MLGRQGFPMGKLFKILSGFIFHGIFRISVYVLKYDSYSAVFYENEVFLFQIIIL